MKSIVIMVNNKISDVIPYSGEMYRKLANKYNVHLCWENCLNACPGRCMKIYNSRKQLINNYDFITDGYQIVKENGVIDKFIVTGCKNYVEEKPKKLTSDEQKRIRKVKEELKMEYFDTSTIEEADLLQNELMQKNKLTGVRGKLPSKERIKRLKRNLN